MANHVCTAATLYETFDTTDAADEAPSRRLSIAKRCRALRDEGPPSEPLRPTAVAPRPAAAPLSEADVCAAVGRLVERLRGHEEGLGASQVAVSLGLDSANCRRVLKQALAARVVRRTGTFAAMRYHANG